MICLLKTTQYVHQKRKEKYFKLEIISWEMIASKTNPLLVYCPFESQSRPLIWPVSHVSDILVNWNPHTLSD